MKRKITLLLCLFVALAIVLTGCPKMNEPVEPDSNAKSFIRLHQGGEYDGFTELFFENYKDSIKGSKSAYIYRKAEDETDYDVIYTFRVKKQTEYLSPIPAVIDYYAEKNVKYTYKLGFGDYDKPLTFSDESVFTTAKSIAKPTVTGGIATFDVNTGIFEFSTLPQIHYTPLSFFSSYATGRLSYSYNYNNSKYTISLAISKFTGTEKFNLYDYLQLIQYTDLMGSTLTPDSFVLEMYNDESSFYTFYDSYIDCPDLPIITLPDEIPCEPFLKSSEQVSFAGFNEIYFDNYSDLVQRSTEIRIQRQKQNGKWETIYKIMSNSYGQPLTELPPVIDYYAEEGKTYKYMISFRNWNSEVYLNEDTPPISITTANSYGPIVFSPGSATYNSETGEFKITQSSSFSFTEPTSPVFFSSSLEYSYQYDSVSRYTMKLSLEGDTDIQQEFENAVPDWKNIVRGKTMTPNSVLLNIDFSTSGLTVTYLSEFYNVSSFPAIIISDSW